MKIDLSKLPDRWGVEISMPPADGHRPYLASCSIYRNDGLHMAAIRANTPQEAFDGAMAKVTLFGKPRGRKAYLTDAHPMEQAIPFPGSDDLTQPHDERGIPSQETGLEKCE